MYCDQVKAMTRQVFKKYPQKTSYAFLLRKTSNLRMTIIAIRVQWMFPREHRSSTKFMQEYIICIYQVIVLNKSASVGLCLMILKKRGGGFWIMSH